MFSFGVFYCLVLCGYVFELLVPGMVPWFGLLVMRVGCGLWLCFDCVVVVVCSWFGFGFVVCCFMWVVCWVVLLCRARLLVLFCYRCVVLVGLYLLLIWLGLLIVLL